MDLKFTKELGRIYLTNEEWPSTIKVDQSLILEADPTFLKYDGERQSLTFHVENGEATYDYVETVWLGSTHTFKLREGALHGVEQPAASPR